MRFIHDKMIFKLNNNRVINKFITGHRNDFKLYKLWLSTYDNIINPFYIFKGFV